MQDTNKKQPIFLLESDFLFANKKPDSSKKSVAFYLCLAFKLQIKSRTPVKSDLLFISLQEALFTATRFFT